MGEKKRMRKGIEKESTTKGQPFAKKETMAEGKISTPRPRATPSQIQDSVLKLKSLKKEGRIRICPGFSTLLGRMVDVDSMGLGVRFDLGALKVLEEAQARGLLSKMSLFRFSGFQGPLRAETAKTKEQRRQFEQRDAAFLKFFSELLEI